MSLKRRCLKTAEVTMNACFLVLRKDSSLSQAAIIIASRVINLGMEVATQVAFLCTNILPEFLNRIQVRVSCRDFPSVAVLAIKVDLLKNRSV